MLRPILLTCALVACRSDDVPEITGPFTGAVHRFAVSALAMPTQKTDLYGGDLDGDGVSDNQLRAVMATLAGQNDANTHVADMIAAGSLASSVEIQTDDLVAGQVVGVVYRGADGEAAVVTGGRFEGGILATNRTSSSQHLGTAHVRLPMFADIDPIDVELDGIEFDLVPQGSGYLGTIRGAIPMAAIPDAVTHAVTAMILANPADHLKFERLLDTNDDGVLTTDEIVNNGLLSSLLAPDIDLLGQPALSVGFQIQLVACPSGACAATAGPTSDCFDRLRDGDETDVDCGGSCSLRCTAGQTCAVAGDCESAGCDNGHCRAPTCADGIRDGLESAVDCGASCGPCPGGKTCVVQADCASKNCVYGSQDVGTCTSP